ncbi:MAG: helix-turn-helix domain-containing protein [Planctomycetota bacterium]
MPRSRNIHLTLDPTAQLELKRLTQLPSTPAVVYRRARAILLLASGMRYKEVARLADLDRANIFRWTKRYMDRGVVGLKDLCRIKASPSKLVATRDSNPVHRVGERSFAESLREIQLRNEKFEQDGLLAQQQTHDDDDADCFVPNPGLATHSTALYEKVMVVPYSDQTQVV